MIPVHNAARNVPRVLEAIRAAAGPDAEIIIVDDGSLDDSARLAEPFADLLIRRPCQGGAARARNDGARRARGEVLVFIDSDVLVSPAAVQGLLRIIDDGADAAFGSYTPLPPPEARNTATTFKNVIHHYTHQTSSREASTFWSGFGAIRREAFMAVDGFDPAVTSSADVEDIHLGYRLTAQGYRIVLDPTLQVEHLKQYTFREMVLSDFWHRAIPWTRAMLALRTFKADLNLHASSMLSGSVTWLLLVAIAATVVVDVEIAFLVAILAVTWIALNAPFLRTVRREWDTRGAFVSAAILFLVYIYASIGALVGVILYGLRHDRHSQRNRLHLDLEPLDPSQPREQRLTVAILAGDVSDPPALGSLGGDDDYQLLIVGSKPPTTPTTARFVPVPSGATRSKMSQAALEAASGQALTLLEGAYVPDEGWLDRVREAASLRFIMVGGSFEPASDRIADRAIHLARLWPWRSNLPRAWLAYHPAHNTVIDARAARAVGGFGPEGGLLLRLSGLGARPVLFDPEMCVRRGHPPTFRELMPAQVGPARRNTASWAHYLDYSLGHRIVSVATAPFVWLTVVPRRILQAMRERRADFWFWLATPLAFLSNGCSVAGDAIGMLSRRTSGPTIAPDEVVVGLEPDQV